MTMMVLDTTEERRLKAERARTGADRFDEVWEGVYMMAPLANNEHQSLAFRLAVVIQSVVPFPDASEVYVGVNVSDREKDWKKNYRCPDVGVFLKGTQAVNCGTHWWGGPDFAAEVVSPKDRSRDKLRFYAKVGVRELLVIDRQPWRLELYRLDKAVLKLAGVSNRRRPDSLESEVLPQTFRLAAGGKRLAIQISHSDGIQQWLL